MSSERYQLGLAKHVRPEALGQPGQRTFRLLLATDSQSACLWMEKEQMQALAMAVDQLVAQLRANRIRSQSRDADVRTAEATDFGLPAEIEFKVSRLGLGYDQDTDHLVILAHELDADEDEPATLSIRATRAQMRQLSTEITRVVSAGRPRCALCGAPLTGEKHSCAGSNGHHPESLNV
jgi:uncharacterized repeat protein (TIGR03847 family)